MEPCSHLVRWGAHEVHVAEWGERDRDTVVLWHGLARHCRDFDTCARALARDYRVLCPDTIGRGLSSWAADPTREYCFASYARLALAFAQVLDRLAQEGGGAVVKRLEGGDGLPGIADALARAGLRAGNRFDGLRVNALFHDPL